MTDTVPLTFRGDLDVPEGLPRGIDLGRIANADKAIGCSGARWSRR